MLVLGVRVSPDGIRYALVEVTGESCKLVNAETENRLRLPAGFSGLSEKLKWIYDELLRIIRQNSEIVRIGLKTGEYNKMREPNPLTYYFEAMVILAAATTNIDVSTKRYGQLGTNGKEAQDYAERLVGKTSRNWDRQIADAIIAAKVCADET